MSLVMYNIVWVILDLHIKYRMSWCGLYTSCICCRWRWEHSTRTCMDCCHRERAWTAAIENVHGLLPTRTCVDCCHRCHLQINDYFITNVYRKSYTTLEINCIISFTISTLCLFFIYINIFYVICKSVKCFELYFIYICIKNIFMLLLTSGN